MCGIVGVMGHNGQLPHEYTKLFRQLLIIDTLRGEDSTGVLSLVGKKKLVQIREPFDGYTFTWQKPFFDLMNKHNKQHKFLLGHNRAATVGEITKETAHPFVFSRIAGVHNGTITSFGAWERKDKDMKQFPVDSQQLYFLINKYGVDAALKETFGSYALVFFNYENKTLNFIRNNLRPMWFAHTYAGMYWASEKEMLELILKRNQVHNVTYEMLPANELWEFKIGDTKNPTKTKDVGVVPYTPPANTHNRGRHRHNNRDTWTQRHYDDDAYAWDEYMPPVNNRSAFNGLPRLPRSGDTADMVDRIIDNVGGSRSKAMEGHYPGDKFDYTKEYPAKVTHTSFASGSYTIHGTITDEQYKGFNIYGCSGVEFQRWHNKELRVHIKYYDAKRDLFTVRPHDIRIVNKLNSEKQGELMAMGPGNVLIPISELNYILSEGCLCCGKKLDAENDKQIFWSDDEVPHPICESCIGSWDLFCQDRDKSKQLH